jgi:hypothetical protein
MARIGGTDRQDLLILMAAVPKMLPTAIPMCMCLVFDGQSRREKRCAKPSKKFAKKC